MIFDKMAGFVEKYLPSAKPTMDLAKLFVIESHPQDILNKSEGELSKYDNFFLPFKVTAIEDKTSCKVVTDVYENQKGVEGERLLLVCYKTKPEMYYTDPNDPEKTAIQEAKMKEQGTYEYLFIQMEFEVSKHKTSGLLQTSAGIHKIFSFGKKGFHVVENEHFITEDGHMLTNPVIPTIEEVIAINDPETFILEETPVKTRNRNLKKIIRSHDRQNYVLLTPGQIRKKMKLTTPEKAGGGKRIPHDRRRHKRTLRSDKFINSKGKTIIIPACWIGDSEATIGNKHYRVRLDL